MAAQARAVYLESELERERGRSRMLDVDAEGKDAKIHELEHQVVKLERALDSLRRDYDELRVVQGPSANSRTLHRLQVSLSPPSLPLSPSLSLSLSLPIAAPSTGCRSSYTRGWATLARHMMAPGPPSRAT